MGPFKNFLKARTAHVVLAQEVKTSGPSSEILKDWARRNGWKILVADADYRPHTDAHSAGVAILARDWLGLGWPPGCGPTTKDGRVIIGMLECPFLPPMLIASIYLKTGIGGATPYNLELLKYAGQTACRGSSGAISKWHPAPSAQRSFPKPQERRSSRILTQWGHASTREASPPLISS